MKLIANPLPRQVLKTDAKMLSEVLEILGLSGIEIAGNEDTLINAMAAELQSERKGKYRNPSNLGMAGSRFGILYGKCLSSKYGWKECWLTEGPRKKWYDGIYAVCSPQNEYLVWPIDIARKEILGKTPMLLTVCRVIEAADDSAAADSFTELNEKGVQAPIPQPPPFSESGCNKLKTDAGCELPKDYIAFMRSFDDTLPERSFFWVVKGDWGSELFRLYSIVDPANTDATDIVTATAQWRGIALKPGLLPIGDDDSSGTVLLSIRPEDFGSVHYCCPWSDDGQTDIFESQGYWKVADNFSDFFANLRKSPDA